MAIEDRYKSLSFPEAINLLKNKISVDTDRWDDVIQAAQSDSISDSVFTIAGAKGALLNDLRTAVDKAISEGRRLSEFQKDFDKITENWTHTGSKDFRARIIYQTNMRQAYAAGRYSYQLDPDVVKLQPYLQYIHSDSRTPRPAHIALDGKVFRANEMPFYPPAGFGCSCRTISLTQRQLDRQGLEVSDIQRGDLADYRDDRGQVRQAKIEPDRGFDYIPGRTTPEERRILLDNLPPDLRAQALAEVARLAPDAVAPATKPQTWQEFVKLAEDRHQKQLAAIDKALVPSKKLMALEKVRDEIADEMQRLPNAPIELIEKYWEASDAAADQFNIEQKKSLTKMAGLRSKLAKGMSAKDARAVADTIRISNSVQQVSPATDLAKIQAGLKSDLVSFYQITRGRGASILDALSYTGERAYASRQYRYVNIGDGNTDTIFHEVGHFFEYENPVYRQASKDWIVSRATGAPQKLSTLTGNSGYKDDEIAYPDKFLSEYVGRDYSERFRKAGLDPSESSTEVVSMGLERFSSPEKMLEFYKADKEHFKLILGMLEDV